MNILPPRYTQIPNELLDHLQDFSKAEIVILMVLCRLTFGYHRTTATASNSYVAKLAGMATSTVIRNAQLLAEKGVITHGVANTGFSTWSIVINEEPEPAKEKPAEKTYTPAQETMYAKAQVLAEVCHMDFAANKGMLLGHAKKLPISTEEIRDLFGPGGAWYRYDFRGKKNSPPSLKQVSTEFLRLKQNDVSAGESLDGPSNAVVKGDEIYV